MFPEVSVEWKSVCAFTTQRMAILIKVKNVFHLFRS